MTARLPMPYDGAISNAAMNAGSPPAGLPLRMKALHVAAEQGGGRWLSDALSADGATHVVLEEAAGAAAGLALLRAEVFDVVLVTHAPGVLDALELVAGLRAGGHDEPLIILGRQPPHAVDALCYEAGADEYCCIAETTVRGLLWRLVRAMQRAEIVRENRRLMQAERQRLSQEHGEAQRLLDQQRTLVSDLERLCTDLGELDDAGLDSSGNVTAGERSSPTSSVAAVSPALAAHYGDLLRTYVIMGAGNLADEMASLAGSLAAAGVSAQQALALHVAALEELVQGLGNRSARHVMNRADLLALEVLGHLADGYRQRYHERRRPPEQQLLPGFDGAASRFPASSIIAA